MPSHMPQTWRCVGRDARHILWRLPMPDEACRPRLARGTPTPKSAWPARVMAPLLGRPSTRAAITALPAWRPSSGSEANPPAGEPGTGGVMRGPHTGRRPGPGGDIARGRCSCQGPDPLRPAPTLQLLTVAKFQPPNSLCVSRFHCQDGWPGGLPSPTVYFEMRARQLAVLYRSCHVYVAQG